MLEIKPDDLVNKHQRCPERYKAQRVNGDYERKFLLNNQQL